MTKSIPLTQGKFTVIDADDFERVSKFKWQFSGGYARRSQYISGSGRRAKKKAVLWVLARFLLNFPEGGHVDHVNGDCLDNRKSNLRHCTQMQNIRNQKSRATSGLKGVKKTGWGGKSWMANICVNYEQIYLGCFYDKRTAALVYNNAAQKYFGEFARLNNLKGLK